MNRLTRTAISALFLSASVSIFAAAKPTSKLSQPEAEKIALAKEAGTVTSGELEKEHGKWIYSFDVKSPTAVHEVNVDANTGKVVEDSVEDPKAEAKEMKAEAKAKQAKDKKAKAAEPQQ